MRGWPASSRKDVQIGGRSRKTTAGATIMFAAHNQHYEFVRDGLTTPDAGGEMDNLMLFLVTQPGARHWWREWKTMFPEAFRDHTDGLIREGEAAD
jgi:hypothetical protein